MRVRFLYSMTVLVLLTVVIPAGGFFEIEVVDRVTGRGVPLIELRTVNDVRYFTDSAGIVAFDEPGLMGREVFFFVEGHGYKYPEDGFGFQGVRLKPVHGGRSRIEVERVNIARRLYRVTGEGIYRDSILAGRAAPIRYPLLNGQVAGQDSVYTCLYKGRLFWLWGDTSRPSYPLGHFGTAGAWSALPDAGGLDPCAGVDLEYIVGSDGFSRALCLMKQNSMYWLDGLMVVQGGDYGECMVAMCARIKSLEEVYERGLVVFDDESESFRWAVASGVDFLPYSNAGHTFRVHIGRQRFHYFGTQFPLSVRMRVADQWNAVCDPNSYEVYTAIGSCQGHRWIRAGRLLAGRGWKMEELVSRLSIEKAGTRLYDIESGRAVIPHGGSIEYNRYRGRWVMITVEHFGGPSVLGEVWYAEADTPVGPWCYARRIVTHNKYSFYNPMQHAYFAEEGGRRIYFEGTYAHTFSRPKEFATPRYDYNQMMYRLDVDDERLYLPAAVFLVDGEYMLGGPVAGKCRWDLVESVPFFAMAPDRAGTNMIAVYQVGEPDLRLTTVRPEKSGAPVFYGLSADDLEIENSMIVPLLEYRNNQTGKWVYSTDENFDQEGFVRSKEPICRVAKAAGELMFDARAEYKSAK